MAEACVSTLSGGLVTLPLCHRTS